MTSRARHDFVGRVQKRVSALNGRILRNLSETGRARKGLLESTIRLSMNGKVMEEETDDLDPEFDDQPTLGHLHRWMLSRASVSRLRTVNSRRPEGELSPARGIMDPGFFSNVADGSPYSDALHCPLPRSDINLGRPNFDLIGRIPRTSHPVPTDAGTHPHVATMTLRVALTLPVRVWRAQIRD